jgi:UPF0042 nucleotide-binding protein
MLEDLGYFCSDNFPPALVPAFIAQGLPEGALALEMDPRSTNQFDLEVTTAMQALKEAGRVPTLVFVEADAQAILARYALTRRPHPLIAHCGSLSAAIAQDAERLAPVRSLAQVVLDTSTWGLKDLRQQVETLVQGQAPVMQVNLMSFGYKYSVPPEANIVFDIRFLPNPYYVPELRELTGRDAEVVDYVFNSQEARITYGQVAQTLTFFLERYRQERRGQVTVAVGCTGGQHRSVAFVERLAQTLSQENWQVHRYHREQDSRSNRLGHH